MQLSKYLFHYLSYRVIHILYKCIITPFVKNYEYYIRISFGYPKCLKKKNCETVVK